ncbi:2-phospho-L-lactate guanylyltransferase [Nocardioides exalbidus]|uniref:2-phospho-L-lactate guanylyltransferase n=1 Tax=Nocardioides exalbidus TaxID=402596 RepID=A0A1H4QQM0_9ACTN|nr:hypothetical protein [Nocardioides exalbidus]SEC21966.1 2-phospho-L-lactate guanylyltransferase [Nocardioides exalbidus]
MSRVSASGRDVSVVVLAKDTSVAKTRLRDERSRTQRLALEMAVHTLGTAVEATRAGSVFVVTSDPELTSWAARNDVVVVGEGRPIGMNAAAALGSRRALATHPHLPVAVMVADLPELAASDLRLVVDEHLERRMPLVVADHHGDGTTCLVHGTRTRPGFGFGRGSAEAHRRLGYVAAQRPLRGLRRDLDPPTTCDRSRERRGWRRPSPDGVASPTASPRRPAGGVPRVDVPRAPQVPRLGGTEQERA